MKLVLDRKRSAKKHKSPLQKRFDKLRNALDKERRRSACFRKDLDGLVETYQSRSIEHDRRAFDDLVALSERLIVFASRKSLSDWHRSELLLWIRDLSERRITPIDPEVAERLQRDYNEAVARAMGMSIDEMEADIEAVIRERARARGDGFGDGFDGHFDERDGAETPEDNGEYARASGGDSQQADMFGFDDIDPETFDKEEERDWLDEDDDEDEDEIDISRTVMDGSWAKKLFRRAAQVLHPDREPDPERREFKQARLRELLAARKQGDIMTMLSIYSESVSDADIVLAEQEMTEVCDVLENQLDDLRLDREEYIHSHPLRRLAFELFYDNTTKGRQRRIAEWERERKREAAELRKLTPTLGNLDSLKRVLRDRRDEREAALFESMLGDMLFR